MSVSDSVHTCKGYLFIYFTKMCNYYKLSSKLTVFRLHRMHEVQTIVADVRGVCPKSVTRGHSSISVQPLPNKFGLLLLSILTFVSHCGCHKWCIDYELKYLSTKRWRQLLWYCNLFHLSKVSSNKAHTHNVSRCLTPQAGYCWATWERRHGHQADPGTARNAERRNA